MKKIKHSIYLALALALAIGCTDDGDGAGQSPEIPSHAVELTASLHSRGDAPQRGSHAAPETRANSSPYQGEVPATRAEGSTWHAGDAIGLYMLQSGTTAVSRGMANRRYINATTGTTATFAPDGEANTAWYPSGGEEVDLIAYYPHNGQLTMDNGQLTLPVSVADQTSLPAIDLMTSDLSEGHSSDADKRAANLRFTHRLAKIVLDLKKGEGTEWLNLAEAKVPIGGTPATAVYNLYTAGFESYGEVQEIELNMMGGRTTGIVIPPLQGGGAGESPETGSDAVTFTVTVADETFVATLPADKPLGSGKEARITIRLDFTQPTIEAEIVDWITGTEAEIPALTIAVPPGPSGQPAVQAFGLWRTADDTDVRTYAWNDDAGKWTATPAPFYIEHLTVGEIFQAEHHYEDYTDPVTGIDDMLTASATLESNYTLNLDFTHVNALFSLEIKPQILTEADWKAATVKPAINNPGENTATGSLKYSFIVTPGIVVPTGELLATIVAKGITYEVRAASTITFTRATDTQVSVIIEGTQPGINVEVIPWTTTGGSGSIEITDVTKGTDLSALPGDGDVTITPDGRSTVEYRYENGILTAQGRPLYWEDFVKYEANTTTLKNYNFSFHYEPDDATGIDKDILREESKSITWGNSLSFSNLLHENTEIIVVLKKGSSFQDANWNDATVTLTGFDGKPSYTMRKKSIGTELEMNPVVVTKDQASAGKFVNLTLNGVDYKAEIGGVNNIPTTLLGGKSYKLTLMLEKTAIGVGSVTIEDFEEVPGTGGIEYN